MAEPEDVWNEGEDAPWDVEEPRRFNWFGALLALMLAISLAWCGVKMAGWPSADTVEDSMATDGIYLVMDTESELSGGMYLERLGATTVNTTSSFRGLTR